MLAQQLCCLGKMHCPPATSPPALPHPASCHPGQLHGLDEFRSEVLGRIGAMEQKLMLMMRHLGVKESHRPPLQPAQKRGAAAAGAAGLAGPDTATTPTAVQRQGVGHRYIQSWMSVGARSCGLLSHARILFISACQIGYIRRSDEI